MPVSLPPISRRRFLASVGASAALLAMPAARADESREVDPDLVALLNDPHIGEKHAPNSPIPTHLRQTVEYLLKLPRKPAAVFINGDLALKDGQAGDYEHFARLIQPLREAGMTLHLTMGNHDNRETFYRVISGQWRTAMPVLAKYVAVVETARANFFLLDSLKETMVAQGLLGPGQLKWLAAELDRRPDKPAVVMGHHNPRVGGEAKHYPGGLEDTGPLWDVIASRPHAKAYVHGHIHDWGLSEHRGVHIVNTPATSYVGNPAQSTTGWTMARLGDAGVTLTTHTHIPDHPWNDKSHELTWRRSA